MENIIVDHICPICKTAYRGEAWKRKCYDCYKSFRYRARIQNIRHKSEIYLAHPSVTAEEVDAFIAQSKHEKGWGAQEWKPEDWSNFKIFVDSTNFD